MPEGDVYWACAKYTSLLSYGFLTYPTRRRRNGAYVRNVEETPVPRTLLSTLVV